MLKDPRKWFNGKAKWFILPHKWFNNHANWFKQDSVFPKKGILSSREAKTMKY
jgi:hypothetical protein